MSELIDISPLVSERIAVWPGDVPFTRAVGLSIECGDNISLSSVRTSVHAGSHADAPSHYARGGVPIERLSLDLFFGPCQVVSVEVGRGKRIRPEDIEDEIEAPRILVKTGTFPNPEEFTTDFAAFSVELVEHLASKGVRLAGIDTPSVDLFDDEVLEAHQALFRHDMANLENLVLDPVKPGFFTLIALPLRIESADAAPVRAALLPR